AVLGYIEASEEDAARFAKQTPAEPQGDVAAEIPGRDDEKAKSGNGAHFQIDESAVRTSRISTQAAAPGGGLPVPAVDKGAGFLSPRVLALALAENPAAAAKLIGARVLQSSTIDIGLAIEAQDGIIVPIIRNADKTSLADLTTKYEELVSLGRARRISPEMQSGGIAAVSNFGTFGVEWGTPIPLPDQTIILGLGIGKKTPRWDESKSEFVPVTEAQITLSFDHRSLDG